MHMEITASIPTGHSACLNTSTKVVTIYGKENNIIGTAIWQQESLEGCSAPISAETHERLAHALKCAVIAEFAKLELEGIYYENPGIELISIEDAIQYLRKQAGKE